MSHAATSAQDPDSEPPFKVDKRYFGLRLETLAAVIGATFMAALAYATIKNEQSRQSEKLQSMETRQSTMEQTLIAQRDLLIGYRYTFEAVNQKLDYLTGGRRGPAPASGSTP